MNNQDNLQSKTTTCSLGEAMAALITEEMHLAGPLPSVAELTGHLRQARAALRKPADLFHTLFPCCWPGKGSASRIITSRLGEQPLAVLLGTLAALMQGRPVPLSEQVIKILGAVPPVALGDVLISYHAVRLVDAGTVHAALTRHRAGPTYVNPAAGALPLRSWVSEYTTTDGRPYALSTVEGMGTMIVTAAEALALAAKQPFNPGNT